ncbi:MAG: hypothetical protein HYV65_03355 [Candidatus Spechtbacteria bacterium]|nr:hypothetical protein [Candidatus Spechtbacteria bacterium]
MLRSLLLTLLSAVGLSAFYPATAVLAGGPSTDCVELTGLQIAAGFVTWMNILQVFAIALAVICFGYLISRWFRWLIEIFLHVPEEVYEVLLYIASIGLVVSGHWVSAINQLWPVLGGSLLFGVALTITAALHPVQFNKPDRFFGILFLVWSAVALYYQNEVVGFIAVAAFMGMLGFSVLIAPGMYALGFEDEDAVAKATTAAFMVLGVFVGLHVLRTTIPYMQVFEQGALWMGSFVGYLGLLIASSRWYGNARTYPIMQVTTILLGFAAIAVGSVFGVPQLLGIGGTFFVLYLIEKPFEIPVDSAIGYAFIGLLVALCVGGGVWWAQNNMDIVRPYLLF